VQEFLARVTEREPNPPRSVGFGRVLGVVIHSSLGFAGFGFGFLMIVGSIGFLLGSKGALAPQLIGWAFVFFGLVLIAIPFLFARRVAHALKTGVLSIATVVSLDTSLGPGRKTLDSMRTDSWLVFVGYSTLRETLRSTLSTTGRVPRTFIRDRRCRSC
jgi:hypothetical protein